MRAVQGRERTAAHTVRTFAVLACLALVALLAACAHRAPRFGDAPEQASILRGSHAWHLAAAFDASGAPDDGWRLAENAPLQLLFLPSGLAVQGLCHAVVASYGGTGWRLEVGAPKRTSNSPANDCDEPARMRLEQRVALRLPELRRYAVRGGAIPRLVLFFADGGRWELSGTPSAHTRYASPGEPVFLEVAPQRVHCPYGLMAHFQCLQVRGIRYDGQGAKHATGPWQPFYGVIQGYTHEPGVYSALRIQRFRQQPPPARGSVYAYVLDEVLEAEPVLPEAEGRSPPMPTRVDVDG